MLFGVGAGAHLIEWGKHTNDGVLFFFIHVPVCSHYTFNPLVSVLLCVKVCHFVLFASLCTCTCNCLHHNLPLPHTITTSLYLTPSQPPSTSHHHNLPLSHTITTSLYPTPSQPPSTPHHHNLPLPHTITTSLYPTPSQPPSTPHHHNLPLPHHHNLPLSHTITTSLYPTPSQPPSTSHIPPMYHTYIQHDGCAWGRGRGGGG